MSSSVRLPPLIAYPERRFDAPVGLDAVLASAAAALRASATTGRARRFAPLLALVAAQDLRGLSDRALREAAQAAGAALRADPAHGDASLAQVLAPVAEAASRVLGQRPYPPQLLAAAACARGMMAEMATGEGKTLAASLAAATIALSGTPVHLVTVNRYLAERDAAFAAPLHAFLGLTSGVVTEAVDPAGRARAYRCDVTVAVNKDLAFDYMRDRMALGRRLGNIRRKVAGLSGEIARPPLLRGLYHAIVDEADSVLIDEARTPLVLSGPGVGSGRAPAMFDRALAIAGALVKGVDYLALPGERRVALLPAGRRRLAEAAADETGPPWDVAEERERLVEQALTAQLMLMRDEHYMLRDGKAQIIDEFTGRVMPDRTWNDGLQELVERKEDLALSPGRTTEARMTYQRFFRRYHRLSGLSGTLHEVAGELWRVYAVPVVRVPTHRPDNKTIAKLSGHMDDAAKWRAIVDTVRGCQARGTPVLIGTRTVAASARASDALAGAGIAHTVLSAAQDRGEAGIIAAAGQPGAVTVATNMAGRGTDIRVADDVARLGGLQVIVSEPHEARRIDRQLIGRCGRQGQAGRATSYVSLDDALLMRHVGMLARLLTRSLLHATNGRSVVWAVRRAQRRSEALHAGMRRDLLRADAWMEDAIAFSGEPE